MRRGRSRASSHVSAPLTGCTEDVCELSLHSVLFCRDLSGQEGRGHSPRPGLCAPTMGQSGRGAALGPTVADSRGVSMIMPGGNEDERERLVVWSFDVGCDAWL